MPDRLPP
ncbi:hypothetical protein YPPY10_2848, partial [Yersinia pestis PY-10]